MKTQMNLGTAIEGQNNGSLNTGQSITDYPNDNLVFKNLANLFDCSKMSDSAIRPYQIFTKDAQQEVSQGGIPDLEKLCRDLYNTFFENSRPFSALQFVPILKGFNSISSDEVKRFMDNPKTNHVLVKNNLIKIVLIHWKPGKVSSIHGHAQGGCVFKVLRGRLQEKRFSPNLAQNLLSDGTFHAGSMAYIDDTIAYHSVGNPFNESAISLHVYTPGN